MKIRSMSCLLLNLFALSSCRTTEKSGPTAVSDFGANDKKLEDEDFPGDSRTERRNSWWIDNRNYRIDLFKEFGGPQQAIDGQTEAEIARRAVRVANHGQETLNGGRRLRAFHAKSQACFKGKMTVLDTVLSHEELAFGIFKPKSSGELPSYEIFGRFSNGNSKSQSDAVSDPRGFAVKVLNLNGDPVVADMPEPFPLANGAKFHQDFLGTNSPVFPTRNAKSYVDFHEKTQENERFPVALAAYLLNPFTFDGFRTAEILRRYIDNDIGSLAEITYGSGGAFKMGDRAGKYWLRGCIDERDKSGNLYPRTAKPARPSEDYLEDELESRLANRGEVCMELLVQVQRHPILHPIEDPSVIWKDIPSSVSDAELKNYYADLGIKAPPLDRIRSAEFVRVARMSFPLDENKDFRSNESKASCEGMFFNTWHSMSDHRPLGNINRVRLQAYRESWQFRRARPAER